MAVRRIDLCFATGAILRLRTQDDLLWVRVLTAI